MKKIFVILGITLGALIALAIVKDALIKTVVTSATTMVTGAPTKIKSFSISFLKQSVDIKGFKMYNPKGFPKEAFIDITQVRVDLDIAALLKKKLHLKKVVLDLNEIVVVKNKDGELNIDALKTGAPAKKEPAKKGEPKKPAEQMPMQIDELYLNLGRVISKDYTQGEPPKIDAYEMGLKNKTYKNITSAQQLMTLILAESLKGTAITGAKIFAANAALGVAFLPAGVAVTLIGKDSAQEVFKVAPDRLFDEALALLESMTGRASIKSQDKAGGTIRALVDKSDVAIKIEKNQDGATQMTVSARRLLLPKPEVAQGLIIQISDKVNT